MDNKPRFIFIKPGASKVKQITISLPKIFIGSIVILFLIALSLKVSTDFIVKFSQNSQISKLQKQNTFLEQELKEMGKKILSIRDQVDQIEKLDDKLRSRLDIPPIDADVRQVGIGGSDIAHRSGVEINDSRLGSSIASNQSLLARLSREVKLETESFRELISTMERKEDSLRYLPAIKPVLTGRLTDGFGRRLHPIFKRIMPHHGIDLSANRGTPIIAPADGYVSFTGRNGGYGLYVSINHKYGFETKYGHLQKIYVRRGQFVKRGDKIGEVGNTGISTAPHLHYEIHYRGKAVNPVNYYFDDLVFK